MDDILLNFHLLTLPQLLSARAYKFQRVLHTVASQFNF